MSLCARYDGWESNVMQKLELNVFCKNVDMPWRFKITRRCQLVGLYYIVYFTKIMVELFEKNYTRCGLYNIKLHSKCCISNTHRKQTKLPSIAPISTNCLLMKTEGINHCNNLTNTTPTLCEEAMGDLRPLRVPVYYFTLRKFLVLAHQSL